MAFIGEYLSPGTPEWTAAWAELARDPVNAGQPEPRVCLNEGEVWQYMGPEDDGRQCFRHRCHPATGQREYRKVSV